VLQGNLLDNVAGTNFDGFEAAMIDRRPWRSALKSIATRQWAVLTVIFLVGVAFLFRGSEHLGNQEQHTAIEFVAGLVGVLTGCVLVARFIVLGNRIQMFIGMAFLINGFEDMLLGLHSHTLLENLLGFSYYNSEHVMSSAYSFGRLTFGIVLILAPTLSRKMGPSRHVLQELAIAGGIVLGLISLVGLSLFWVSDLNHIYPGFLVSKPLELALAFLLMLALIQYRKEYDYAKNKLIWWVMLSICIAMSGQFIASISKHHYDLLFDLADIYKVIGYVVLLLGFGFDQISQTDDMQKVQINLETARNEAEAANKAKSAFLANMSHEIRTPMTAILGYTQLLKDEETGDGQIIDRRDAVDIIARNGEHLLAVINDILDLSKIEASMMSVEQVKFSPAAVVSQVHSLSKVRAEGKGVSLDVVFRTPVPSSIIGDPVRTRQILLNLVGNAVKFTNQGSVLMMVSHCTDGANDTLQIEVRDTGIGIDAAVISKLFDPFSQADESTTRLHGGTGLGLGISKRLAGLLGGAISVNSKLHEGSSFTLSIPTHNSDPVKMIRSIEEYDQEINAASQKLREAKAISKPLTGLKILLAEDGPDNARLFVFHLKRAGAEVEAVTDGVQAIKAARKLMKLGLKYDVVLMDMQMPNLDGYQATRRLRKQGYTGPIVALTAHTMAHERDKCLAAGCDDHVGKPVDIERLVECCLAMSRDGIERKAA
jgi:signal transduction histidine kinase/ActR/RegA family two-component response regulator